MHRFEKRPGKIVIMFLVWSFDTARSAPTRADARPSPGLSTMSNIAMSRLTGLGALVVLVGLRWWAPLLLAAVWQLVNRSYLRASAKGVVAVGSKRLCELALVRSQHPRCGDVGAHLRTRPRRQTWMPDLGSGRTVMRIKGPHILPTGTRSVHPRGNRCATTRARTAPPPSRRRARLPATPAACRDRTARGC